MVVFCTYCGQSFTRDEHLERHILTHTNIKPFKCFTCHMSFARRDLLQRHYTVHGRDQNNQEGLPSSDGIIPKSAGRTPIACSNCAKTKTKCDKKFPCSRCAGRNLRCTVRSTRRVSRNAGKSNNATELKHANTSPDGIIRHESGGSKTDSLQAPSGRNSGVQQNLELHMYKGSDSTNQIAKDSVYYSDASLVADFNPKIAANTPLPSVGIPPFQMLPPSSYDDLLFSTNSIYDSSLSSPCFIDWQSYSPYPHDAKLSATFIAPDFACDSDYLKIYQSDNLLDVLPDLSNSTTLVQTPITTPRADIFSANNENFNSPLSEYYSHAHLDKGTDFDDLQSGTTVRDRWSFFRSSPSPPQIFCSRAPKQYLENLEHSWRKYENWNAWQLNVKELEISTNRTPEIVSFQEDSRNKLLEITQVFLHNALETHREDSMGSPRTRTSDSSTDFNPILLPPVHILEQFLCAYTSSFEKYFPLVFRARLDANELLMSCDEKASSLLILMMLAQGATKFHSVETHSFVGGLTEVCRMSLHDLVEKNITLSANSTVLQSALLFTNQAAWSGDKWQMDIAMRQRGMYMAMLKHPGFLLLSGDGIEFCPLSNQNETWLKWSKVEMASRLFYCWAIIDQELSLFHDTTASFAIADFVSPMPESTCLWYAKTATDWDLVYQQIYKPSESFAQDQFIRRPPALLDIFRQLLDIDSSIENVNLTALHLRLLLCPLQIIVFQSQLVANYLPRLSSSQQNIQGSREAASPTNQLIETQAWLDRWHTLVKKYLTTKAICPIIQASLVLFQIISLNTMVDFPAIETAIRGEGIRAGGAVEARNLSAFRHFHTQHLRGGSSFDIRQVVHHCEQVLSLVHAMHRNVRPSWWPGAVYRACLILWTIQSACDRGEGKMGESMMMAPGAADRAGSGSNRGTNVSLASLSSSSSSSLSTSSSSVGEFLADGHQSIAGEQQNNDVAGSPSVSVGVLPGIQDAKGVVSYCVEIIEEGAPSRLAEGIIAKLKRLVDSK